MYGRPRPGLSDDQKIQSTNAPTMCLGYLAPWGAIDDGFGAVRSNPTWNCTATVSSPPASAMDDSNQLDTNEHDQRAGTIDAAIFPAIEDSIGCRCSWECEPLAGTPHGAVTAKDSLTKLASARCASASNMPRPSMKFLAQHFGHIGATMAAEPTQASRLRDPANSW